VMAKTATSTATTGTATMIKVRPSSQDRYDKITMKAIRYLLCSVGEKTSVNVTV
jgi:hypothetical protein